MIIDLFVKNITWHLCMLRKIQNKLSLNTELGKLFFEKLM